MSQEWMFKDNTADWQSAVDRARSTGRGWKPLLYHAGQCMRSGYPLPEPLAEFIADGLDGLRTEQPKGTATLFGCKHARGRRESVLAKIMRALEVEALIRVARCSQLQAAEALSGHHQEENEVDTDPSTWIKAHNDRKQDANMFISSYDPHDEDAAGIEMDLAAEAMEKARSIAKRMTN